LTNVDFSTTTAVATTAVATIAVAAEEGNESEFISGLIGFVP